MLIGFCSCLCALLITGLIIGLQPLHEKFSTDSDLQGPQKFHLKPVPRIGGLSILLSIVFLALVFLLYAPNTALLALQLVVCALPAFLMGFAEDLTKRISANIRLISTFIAAGIAYFWLDIGVIRVDLPFIDTWLMVLPISFILTIVAVAGLSHAVNIIDGFNGLAAMVVIIMLSSLAYVAFALQDVLIMQLSLSLIGIILGFFFWNFPLARIFLGDGGAYLLGFLLAELALLLLIRHPEISAIYPLLLCIYPIFETIFSIYRKRWIQGISPSLPDRQHLHMLVYTYLHYQLTKQNNAYLAWCNALTAPFLWLLCALAVVPATLFWDKPWLLFSTMVLFCYCYIQLYILLNAQNTKNCIKKLAL